MVVHTKDRNRLFNRLRHYLTAQRRVYDVERDYFKIQGQDNIVKYKPAQSLVIRISSDTDPVDVISMIYAAKLSTCNVTVSNSTAKPMTVDIKTLLDQLIPDAA